MDTPTDIALYKIEKEIKDNRSVWPCDSFEPVSKEIAELCSNCGHPRKEHDEEEDS